MVLVEVVPVVAQSGHEVPVCGNGEVVVADAFVNVGWVNIPDVCWRCPSQG